MDNALFVMTKQSVQLYVDSILHFSPISVHVFDTAKVTNIYYSQK